MKIYVIARSVFHTDVPHYPDVRVFTNPKKAMAYLKLMYDIKEEDFVSPPSESSCDREAWTEQFFITKDVSGWQNIEKLMMAESTPMPDETMIYEEKDI